MIAFVGSTCTLSLRHQTRNATDPPAVMLSLSNNAVVAIGSGVLREGWEYGVRPVGDSASGDDVPGHIPTTVDTSANMPELFTVVVRGRSSAFVDRPVLSFEQPPSCARLGSSWMSAAPSEVSPHGSASDENSYESVGDRHGRRSRGRDRRRIGGSTTTSTCYRAPSRSSSSNRENNCHRDDHYPKRRRSRY